MQYLLTQEELDKLKATHQAEIKQLSAKYRKELSDWIEGLLTHLAKNNSFDPMSIQINTYKRQNPAPKQPEGL